MSIICSLSETLMLDLKKSNASEVVHGKLHIHVTTNLGATNSDVSVTSGTGQQRGLDSGTGNEPAADARQATPVSSATTTMATSTNNFSPYEDSLGPLPTGYALMTH